MLPFTTLVLATIASATTTTFSTAGPVGTPVTTIGNSTTAVNGTATVLVPTAVPTIAFEDIKNSKPIPIPRGGPMCYLSTRKVIQDAKNAELQRLAAIEAAREAERQRLAAIEAAKEAERQRIAAEKKAAEEAARKAAEEAAAKKAAEEAAKKAAEEARKEAARKKAEEIKNRVKNKVKDVVDTAVRGICNKNLILKMHNDARREVGVAPLVWDDNLAQRASSWARKMGRENFFDHRGEFNNLYGAESCQDAMDAFLEEKKFFPSNRVLTRANHAKIGHYATIITPRATRVACAVGGGNTVCYYDHVCILGQRVY